MLYTNKNVVDRIIKVQDFETIQRAASPRFQDSCLESQDFETGLIFSEMHHFLLDHSIPLIKVFIPRFIATTVKQ